MKKFKFCLLIVMLTSLILSACTAAVEGPVVVEGPEGELVDEVTIVVWSHGGYGWEWLEYARAINKPSNSLEDRVFGSTSMMPMWNSMNNYMSNPYFMGADGRNLVDNVTTSDWINTFEILVTAYNEKLTLDTAGDLIGTSSTIELFAQGKLGMMDASLADAKYLRDAGVNVALVGQPVVTPGWEGNAGAFMDPFGIMSGSDHPEEAWLFLKFLTYEVGLMKANSDAEEWGSNSPSIIEQAKEWADGTDDPLVDANVTLIERVVAPPFNPDVWAVTGSFYEYWRLMTEENLDVKTALQAMAEEGQEKLDQLWSDFDLLGQ